MSKRKSGSAEDFAHLMPLRAEDTPSDDPKTDAEDEDVDPDADDQDPDKEAEGDDPDKEVEGDDPDKDAEDEDETDPDDPPEEMTGKSGNAQARRRERARCKAIFGHKAAGRNPALAAHLAFNTSMSRSQAIATLKAGGVAAPAASRPGGLAARMSSQPRTVLGQPPASANADQAIATGWGGAFAKATGRA